MRRVVVVLCSTLLALAGLVTAGSVASAAAPPVVLDSLTIPAAAPGQNVTATTKVHSTSGNVAVQAITVAVRSSNGTAFDFPGATAATITPSGYTFTSGARSFTAGTYTAFTAILVGGQWTNLTPSKTFTVAAASNPVTFFQQFNGAAGGDANSTTTGDVKPTKTWVTDPCWKNKPACTGSLAEYRDDHARLDGAGSLVLTADRNVTPGATCPPVSCSYATSRLTMLDWLSNGGRPTWSQTGGHFEARIKSPLGRGLWPAFWTIGDQVTGTWPRTGEIDVMEALGQNPTTVEQHAHGGSPDINYPKNDPPYTLPSGNIAGWHTYAVDWNPAANGYIKWSVDGVVTRTLTAAEAGSAWPSFQGPQAVILDLAVGGWPGAPDSSTVFPAKMYVDYVRVLKNPAR